mgnify:CR=1 FL=1
MSDEPVILIVEDDPNIADLTERMGGSATARRSSLGGAEFVVSFAPAPPPTP